MSNVECHCTHPEEEANKRVLNDVAKNLAENGVKYLLVRKQVQTVMNTKESVADENVDQESNGDLSKYFLPQVPDIQVNTEGEEDEKI